MATASPVSGSMTIKKISMGGFKSYASRDGSSKEAEFSPLINCLVGSNGSGKSNFFAAVQFVLGHGEYRTISPKKRQSLLHEGPGGKVLSAFVEVTLDNHKGRLALEDEADTVLIRRVIGAKTDEYRVNNRNTSAAEVHSMLEAAGLSPSNPYNIVQQGKIARFALMSDTERFELLKEVAGTKVYEERRQKSVDALKDADEKMAQAKTYIGNLETRLSELGEEREEFKKYRELESMHKCLLYAMHKREADAAAAELKSIQASLEGSDRSAQEALVKLTEASNAVKATDRAASAAAVAVQQSKRQREVVLQERTGWVKRLALSQVSYNTNNAAKVEAAEQLKRTNDSLASVKKEIAKVQEDLKARTETAGQMDGALAKTTHDLATLEASVNALVAKRGRHNQFSTQADRDKWLNQQIAKQEKALKQYKAELDKIVDERDVSIPQRIEAIQTDVAEKRATLSRGATENDARRATIEKLATERDALAEERRRLFRDQAKTQQSIDGVTEREASFQQKLNRAMPRDVQLGHKSVAEAVEKAGITGVHGTVVELFKTSEDLHTCCDVMAGNSLFNIVVDDNTVASKILSYINKHKLPGRPSFYPLNRLRATAKNLPTLDDCFPLYSKLEFEPVYAPVMADLFGRVLVCVSLQSAGGHSKTHDCDCVLMSGDKVDRRGGISGGFLGNRVSRMGAHAELAAVKTEATALKERLAALAEESAGVDQRMLVARQALQAEEERAMTFVRGKERESNDVRALEGDKHQLELLLRQKQRDVVRQEAEIAQIERSAKGFAAELKTKMTAKLTEAEAAELQRGQAELDEKKKEHSVEVAKVEKLKGEARQLSNQLELNLLKREGELQARVATLTSKADEGRADKHHSHDVDMIKGRIDALDAELKEVEALIDSASAARAKGQADAEKARKSLRELQKKAGAASGGLDDKRRQRVLLVSKYDSAAEQIKRLGALPEGAEAQEKAFAGKKPLVLQKEIMTVRQQLKGLTHVNRKAYDQFTQLSAAREKLTEEYDARIADKKELAKLIVGLDEKKDAAVLLTFKQVKKAFAEAFKELVGHEHASGDLALQKGAADASDGLDQYSGVGVSVDFGVGGDQTERQRMSGGQKTLVALALIFAIQKCDPAPFYIFDEIDAALDATYRVNVANKILRSKSEAQFLLVSFKEEMIDIADRHFMINFQNKVSLLKPCTSDDARDALRQSNSTAARKRKRETDEYVRQDMPTQELG
eukprot:Rhum_TRINITY_DN18914_c0_g1::Rhum_TRINITY_DN18914_c0_g1_i1::g.168827::m.168827/K06669/SMC3, CSPG6; structural maintenance of chromosome 3 (chondroitin sulfate proteoglycan 6)